MKRIERTQIFGHHVISATAHTSPEVGRSGIWEVEVAAMALGSAPYGLLLRFATELTCGDPSAALKAAIDRARRELFAKQS